MAERTLAILVKAIGAAKASKELKGVDAAVSNIGARAGKGLRTAGDNLLRLGTIAAGAAAAGLVGAVKVAADFESQLNVINTVARASPAELDKIGAGIRKLARDTGTALPDLTQGYYDLVSAGIAAADAQGVLTAANTLAIGGLATTAESVDLLTTAINTYGGDASRAGEFADKFAVAIERGKVTASDIATTFATVGPIAAASGIEIDELAASYAQLTAKGVPAAEVATQVRSAIVALTRRTGDLEKLEKKTGKSYLAIAGKKGLVVALQELRTDAEKAGKPLIDMLGRVEGLNFTLATTGPNLEGYNANLAAMGDSAGVAAEQMSERQKGLNYQLGRLKALAIDAGITVGERLLPKLTPLAEKAVAFLETHQSDIDAFGDSIAGGFDKAVQFAEKIPWDTIGSGLRIAAEWAGKLMDAFLGLPKDVQSMIIALAGLNKLSGGAITGIVGELGKGLIKGVLGINAGVVNVNAGVVNGGGVGGVGGVAGGAAAGAGGLLSRILGNPFFRIGAGLGGAALLANSPNVRESAGLNLGANAGGGALTGLAVAGPLGAIAGALAGTVLSVGQAVSADRQAQAQEISGTVDAFIKQSPSVGALQNALEGVDRGIAEIRSNPLLTLVGGEALTELEAQRAALQDALDEARKTSRAGYLTAEAAQNVVDESRRQGAELGTLRQTMEGAARVWNDARAAMQDAAFAIRDLEIPAPVVYASATIQVGVSDREMQQRIKTAFKYKAIPI